MRGSSTHSSHITGGCYFALSFLLVVMMCCVLSIVTFIICLSNTGDVLKSILSAGLCAICSLLIGMGLSLFIYIAAKYIKVKHGQLEKRGYGKGEYVEFEEIIDEEQYDG